MKKPSRTRPLSGEWVLMETDPENSMYGRTFGFTLDALPPAIREAVGDYAWTSYLTKSVCARTIAIQCRNMAYFAEYADMAGLEDLRDLTPEHIDGFVSYLASVKSHRYGKPLAYRSRGLIFKDVRSVIRWLQVNQPDKVAQTALFEGCEFKGMNETRDIDFLSDDVVRQVNAALANEDNLILRNSIRILEATGMRPSELEYLKVDCVKRHPVNGHTIEWFDLKNGVHRKPLPASPACVEAVREIIRATEGIRGELPEGDRSFLLVFKDPHRSFKCKRVRSSLLHIWLKRFAARNGIANADGSKVNLTMRAFRKTLATDMVSKGVDITVVSEVMGHSSTLTTMRYYAKVKDPEMAEAFSKLDPVGAESGWRPSLSPEESSWLSEHACDKALLSDGYCTKPFEDGEMCPRLAAAGQCLTCSRFVTTPEFLDVHRARLADIRSKIDGGGAYGEHYRAHLQPIADMLEQLVAALEAM